MDFPGLITSSARWNFEYFYGISSRMPTKKRDNSIEINRIRVVLAEKKVAQKELAAKVGITPQSVTRMCNNKTQPSLHLLREIAIALDVDITELLIHTKRKSDLY